MNKQVDCLVIKLVAKLSICYPSQLIESSFSRRQKIKNNIDHDDDDNNDGIYRGSYMSAHVLLNLLNELGKRDKMRGLPSILSLFRNEFNKFNNTGARMLDSIYHMTLRLL